MLVHRAHSVGRWARFLHRQNLLLQAPEAPRLRRDLRLQKPRSPLTYEQIQKLMSLPDCSLLWGLRDRTVLEVAYSTGMRLGELAVMETGDVQLEEEMVFVRAPKNRCQRYAPLTTSARHWLWRYLSEVRPALAGQGVDDGSALWLSSTGARLTTNWLAELSTRYRWREVLERPCSFHYLRHSLASHLLVNGADLLTVQVWLGHRNLDATQIYTHLNRLELARNLRNCHPFERVASGVG